MIQSIHIGYTQVLLFIVCCWISYFT